MVVKILYADGSTFIAPTVGDARRLQRERAKTYNFARLARRYASTTFTPILTIIQHDDGGVMIRFCKRRFAVTASDYALLVMARWLTRELKRELYRTGGVINDIT